jgi:ectoine hydroxylase-related dioxygenase (phytanoyl-CoA dioxygenase family)
MNKQIKEEGYTVLKNIFTRNDIEIYRTEIENYIKNNKTIKNAGGITIPDFIKKENFKSINDIIFNAKIREALTEIFEGEDYRFCGHNDIGVDRVVGWHKDKLNNEYAKFETVNIWEKHEGEEHEIVKVLIYLQEHELNDDGLQIIPKSHKESRIVGKKHVKTGSGDVVIFDQRITHRGMEANTIKGRMLVSFGFGKNNIFTDNFEKGTIERQIAQNKTNDTV